MNHSVEVSIALTDDPNADVMFMLRRLPVPLPGQFGSSTDRLVPHDGEVGGAGEVLGDGDRRVQVEDHVPPAACGHTASHNQHHTERRRHD